MNTVELSIRILILIIIFSTTLWLLFRYGNKKIEKENKEKDDFIEFMKKVVMDMEVLFDNKATMSILRGLGLREGHISTSLYDTPAFLKFKSEVIIQAWEQHGAKVVFEEIDFNFGIREKNKQDLIKKMEKL